jgi:hypothetical protein
MDDMGITQMCGVGNISKVGCYMISDRLELVHGFRKHYRN